MKRLFPFLIGLFFIISAGIYAMQLTRHIQIESCIDAGKTWDYQVDICIAADETETQNTLN